MSLGLFALLCMLHNDLRQRDHKSKFPWMNDFIRRENSCEPNPLHKEESREKNMSYELCHFGVGCTGRWSFTQTHTH